MADDSPTPPSEIEVLTARVAQLDSTALYVSEALKALAAEIGAATSHGPALIELACSRILSLGGSLALMQTPAP